MIDYYYKFTNEAEMLTVLSANDMTYTDDDTIYASQGGHQYAAWVVGEMVGYGGYHYNLRLIDESFDVSSLEQYLVVPSAPRVVWA